MTDNSIVNNNNNNNNEIDIFAEDTPEADGRKQDLKHELEEMRAQLPTIIASAPSREDEMDYTDMEVWCRKWMTFYSSFKDLIKLASDCGINYDLSRADKKHGSIGHQTYDRLRRRISEIDEAAAKAEEVARTTAAAQQKKQPRQKKIQQQEDGEIELEVPDGDAAERERPLIKSIRLHGPKRIAPGVNADIESTAVAAMPSAQAGQKKITPRMTAVKKPKETKETKGLVNAVACDRCTSHNRTCYREGNRNVCMDCFRLKVGCSLAGRGQQKSVSPPDATPPPPHQSTSGKGKDKGKGKQKSVSPPHASPPPPDQSTSAANPNPNNNNNNNNNPGSVAKAGPAPKATATSGKGKVADLQHEPEPERPEPEPEPERPAPAASGSQQPYVDILVNRKRKLDIIEIESSAAESDSEKEDANMAGRLDGLRTFLSTFESALGALKQEVFKIDGDLAQKRRRRRLQ